MGYTSGGGYYDSGCDGGNCNTGRDRELAISTADNKYSCTLKPFLPSKEFHEITVSEIKGEEEEGGLWWDKKN